MTSVGRRRHRRLDGCVDVECDQAVLLPADGERPDVAQPPGVGHRGSQGIPPALRVDLGAVGVHRAAGTDDGA